MSVQRYYDGEYAMGEWEEGCPWDGDWVRYSDYQALESKLDDALARLRCAEDEQNEELKGALSRLDSVTRENETHMEGYLDACDKLKAAESRLDKVVKNVGDRCREAALGVEMLVRRSE